MEVAAWLPLLFHLQPPKCVGRVLYDRFSLYHERPAAYGLRLKPSPAYACVYPRPEATLMELAYCFVDERATPPSAPGPGVRALIRETLTWHALFERPLKPVFAMTVVGSTIDFLDTRPCAVARRTRIEGLEAEIYLACEPAVAPEELVRRLGATAARRETVDRAVARLKSLRLLLEVHGRYLALAVPGDQPSLVEPEDFPGGNAEKFDPFTPEALGRFWARMRDLAEMSDARHAGAGLAARRMG